MAAPIKVASVEFNAVYSDQIGCYIIELASYGPNPIPPMFLGLEIWSSISNLQDSIPTPSAVKVAALSSFCMF